VYGVGGFFWGSLVFVGVESFVFLLPTSIAASEGDTMGFSLAFSPFPAFWFLILSWRGEGAFMFSSMNVHFFFFVFAWCERYTPGC